MDDSIRIGTTIRRDIYSCIRKVESIMGKEKKRLGPAELTEIEKRAFDTIKRRLSKCPDWCFCNVRRWHYYERDSDGKPMQIRRFSLNPPCPLLPYLCPPGGLPDVPVSPSTSLYMTTIADTRFNDIIHELEPHEE